MAAFAANSLLCRAALGPGLVDATSFTSVRLGAGALALFVLVRASGRAMAGTRDLRAAVALFVYAFAFSLAYTRIPAAVGALLLFGAVQVTMVGRGLVAGERPGASEWVGLALSLGGLGALVAPGLREADAAGSTLMVGAGLAWGVYSLLGRSSRSDPLAATAVNFAWAVPLASWRASLWQVSARRISPPRVSASRSSRARWRREGATRSGTRRCAAFRRREPASSSCRCLLWRLWGVSFSSARTSRSGWPCRRLRFWAGSRSRSRAGVRRRSLYNGKSRPDPVFG